MISYFYLILTIFTVGDIISLICYDENRGLRILLQRAAVWCKAAEGLCLIPFRAAV